MATKTATEMTANANQAIPRMTTIARGIDTERIQSDKQSKAIHKARSRDRISFFGRRCQNHSALCNSPPLTELFMPRCWIRSVSGGMSGYSVRREPSPSLNGFHIYSFPFLPFRFDPLTLKSHPEACLATQKSCSYAERKGIRESHLPCERSVGAVDSDVPGHKNDSCGRATALAEVISPEPVKAVSRNTGRQTPLPSPLLIATFMKVNPKGPGEPTFTANERVVYSTTPPFENLR
jgi:hypothetical protein